jgi:Protein of unknown function (DUF3309)
LLQCILLLDQEKQSTRMAGTKPPRRLAQSGLALVFVPRRRRFFLWNALAPFLEPLFPRGRCPLGLDRSEATMLGTILIILLILLLVGALPTWPYSSGWGYYPGGGLGLILIIVIVLVLVGRI